VARDRHAPQRILYTLLVPVLEDIVGRFVKLVAPSTEQWEDHLEYHGDEITMEHLSYIGPGPGKWTKDAVVARFERWASFNERGETMMYSLLYQGRFVGHAGLMGLHPGRSTSAEYGIVLGRRAWATPVAPETTMLVLDIAFGRLGLHRIWFTTASANMRMRSVLSRFCHLEGTLRENYRLPDGTYTDSVQYSILDREWELGRQALQRMIDRRAR
jgi:RimJ/RimL family protein N-acetyltransferase